MDLVDLMGMPAVVQASGTPPARGCAAPPTTEAPIRIEDAGEKVGGARKDFAGRALTADELEGMTPEERAALVTKEAVWPRPDYGAASEAGAAPLALALVKILRDRLPGRPTRGYQGTEGIGAYVAMMGIARDALMACRTADEVEAAGAGIMTAAGYTPDMRARRTATPRETARLVRAVYPGRLWPLHVGKAEMARAGRMVAEGFPGKAARRAARPKGDAEGLKTPTRPHLASLGRVGPDRAHPRPLTSERLMDAFGTRSVEYGNWLGNEERREVVALAYDALMDLAEVLGMPSQAVGLGGTLSLAFGARGQSSFPAHYEPLRRVINITRLSGAGYVAHEWAHGLDHRIGTLGHPSPLERNAPRYGSGGRGCQGGRAAALPLLSPAAGQAMDRLMTLTRSTPAMLESGRRIEAASDFLGEARKLSGPTGEYWRRPLEMFARAFEAMVFDRMRGRGHRNDYLVHGVEEDRFAGDEYRGNPYPTGGERAALNGAFGALLDALGDDARWSGGEARLAA